MFRFYNNLLQSTKKIQDGIALRREREKQRVCKLISRKCKIPLEQLEAFYPEKEQDVTRCVQMLHNIFFVRKIVGRYKNETDFSFDAMRESPELIKMVCLNAADREQLEYRQKIWYWLGCTERGMQVLLAE